MGIDIALVIVILILLLIIATDRKEYYKRENRYLNRIMASSLEEYRRVTESMEKSHKELMEEMDKENEMAEKLNDGIRPGMRVV